MQRSSQRIPVARLVLGSLVLSTLGVGCGGCEKKASEPPTVFLSKDAEMVLEIPDLGVVAKRKAALLQRFGALVKPEQVKELEQALTRAIGFDLTTAEGLTAAGLPASGAAAMEFVEQGRGALWVVPVADAEKMTKVLADVVKARMTVDETKDEALAAPLSGQLTTYLRAFGDQKIPIAAVSIQKARGYALIGAGSKAPDIVRAALGRKKEESLASNADYASLSKVADGGFVKLLVPSAQAVMGKLAGGQPSTQGFAKEIMSTAWWLALDEASIALEARVRLSEAGKAQAASFFKTGAKAPGGVLGTLGPEATLIAYGAGDAKTVLDLLAPEGSELRLRLDGSFARAKDELGVDVMTQLLPLSSGHGALAMGFNEFKQLPPLPEFLQAPARYLWTVASVGLKSEADAKKLFDDKSGFDAVAERRGLALEKRKAGAVDVTTMKLKDAPDGFDPVIAELLTHRGAWITTNAGKQTDRVVAAKPVDDALPNGGLLVELRVRPLLATLKALDLSGFQGAAEVMMLRTFQARAVELLEPFQRVAVRVQPASGDLAATLRVEFAPAGAAPASPSSK
jgi:hypothetical protein